jgi:hypothetical protein
MPTCEICSRPRDQIPESEGTNSGIKMATVETCAGTRRIICADCVRRANATFAQADHYGRGKTA